MHLGERAGYARASGNVPHIHSGASDWVRRRQFLILRDNETISASVRLTNVSALEMVLFALDCRTCRA